MSIKQFVTISISFIAGAAIGSIVTRKLLMSEFYKLIDEKVEEETKSIKEVFERDKDRFEEMKQSLSDMDREEKRKELDSYQNKVQSYGYSDQVVATNRYKSYRSDQKVISSSEFMDEAFEEYEREDLTYYADGVLATSNGDEMITEQEADQTIGLDIFRNLRDHFGEYPDDPETVYVRNDETMILYEICRDSRTYLEVTEE